jgi:hypothetical protein
MSGQYIPSCVPHYIESTAWDDGGFHERSVAGTDNIVSACNERQSITDLFYDEKTRGELDMGYATRRGGCVNLPVGVT